MTECQPDVFFAFFKKKTSQSGHQGCNVVWRSNKKFIKKLSGVEG